MQETGRDEHTLPGKEISGKLMVQRPGRASFLRKRNADLVGPENHATRGFVPRELP